VVKVSQHKTRTNARSSIQRRVVSLWHSGRSPSAGGRHVYALSQPLLEVDLAESRVAGRNERALAEFRPEVPRVRVDDNLAGAVARAEALADR